MSIQTIKPKTNVSPENPSQTFFGLPSSVGSGDFFLETFDSGLKLLVMDMKFNHPVILHEAINPHTIGMSFIIKGKSENFSSAYPRPIAIHSGISGYFTFPELVDIGKKI